MARMRVLVTTTGAAGHFNPLVPFARALLERARATRCSSRPADATRPRPCEARQASRVDRRHHRDAARPGFFAQAAAPAGRDEAVGDPPSFARRDVAGRAAAGARGDRDLAPRSRAARVGRVHRADGGRAGRAPDVSVMITLGSSELKFLDPALEGIAPVRAESALPAEQCGRSSATFTLFPLSIEDRILPGPPGVQRFREELPRPAGCPTGGPGRGTRSSTSRSAPSPPTSARSRSCSTPRSAPRAAAGPAADDHGTRHGSLVARRRPRERARGAVGAAGRT